MNPRDVVQGRYRLEEELGRGGMATVWRAHDLRLERPVALKCLMSPLSENPEFLVRFFSEAQQVARLSDPNVVRVLDFGQGGECPYLVMEYLPGGSLADLTGEPIEPSRAVGLIAGAARGAGAAHQAGLVHRDLKPGNIMLADEDIPKIGDFGIAVSDAQERLTATGTTIGSPHYVSPEQASGRPIGPASDVYSLGVVLYELLTGRRPFEGDNAMQLAIAHVEDVPQPPSFHNKELSPALDAVVMRCLAKEPGERFPDGAVLAEALESLELQRDTAPFATAPASSAAAEVAADEVPARNTRRILSVALLAALFVGLLVFGVMVLGGDGGRNEDTAAADVPRGGSVNVGESPSNPAVDNDDVGHLDEGTGRTPSPTASPDDAGPTEAKEKKETDVRGSTSGSDEEWSEPTPEPTAEPQPTEPSPEPTSS